MAGHEIGANMKRLREPFRPWLGGVGQLQSQLGTVAEKTLEQWQIPRCGNEEDFANSGQHQHRQRIVDHRLVVDRQQLLGHRQRNRMQPAAGAAGEDDAFHLQKRNGSAGKWKCETESPGI